MMVWGTLSLFLFLHSLTHSLTQVPAIAKKFYPDRIEELRDRLLSMYGKTFVINSNISTTYYLIEDEYELFVRCAGDTIVHREAISIMPKSLNVIRASKAQMLLNILKDLDTMDDVLARDVAQVVLRDFSRLCAQNKNFRDQVREMKFVPDSQGNLRKPSELFDPRVEVIQDLLSSRLPASPFDSALHLATLTHLGLRNKLSPDAVLQSAREIAKDIQNSDETRKRSTRLLAWLDLHCTSSWLKSPVFLKEIRRVCWIPVVSRVEDSRLAQSSSTVNREAAKIIPWVTCDSRNAVNSPEQTRPHTDTILVSGVMSIFDGEIRNTMLIRMLGWDLDVPGDVIARQLVELAKSHAIFLKECEMKEKETKEEENNSTKKEDEDESTKKKEESTKKENNTRKDETTRTISRLVPQMYRHLDEHFTEEISKILTPTTPWIYSNTHNIFLPVSKVAFECPPNAEPYLYKCPASLAESHHREMLLKLGVRNTFEARDCGRALSSLPRDRKLDKEEIQFAIALSRLIAADTKSSYDVAVLASYLPSKDGWMRRSKLLYYNDTPWLDDLEDCNILHHKIDEISASKLQVCCDV